MGEREPMNRTTNRPLTEKEQLVPQIVSISYKPADIEQRPENHFARVRVERVALVAGRGIEGDTKGRGGNRQLNVMLAETVAWLHAEGFRTAPGALGEQLVIAGLEPSLLIEGARLRLGEAAVIEVTAPREPCSRFEHIQGKPIKAAWGRIGVMARVVCGGEIAVGAEVAVVPSAAASGCPVSAEESR
jgi:MOSC domain-containing protein YiiM